MPKEKKEIEEVKEEKIDHFKLLSDKVKADIKECRSRNSYDVDDAAQLAGYIEAYSHLNLITEKQHDSLFNIIGIAEQQEK